MTRLANFIFSILLWCFGGTLYFLLEIIYKTLTGHPERISWTMLILAIILCIPIERCGAELPWKCPLIIQAFICSVLVIFSELIAGLILNIYFNLNIWDYSDLPFNFYGQICLQFSIIWYFLCLIFIPIFDLIRYIIVGGEKPKYYLF